MYYMGEYINIILLDGKMDVPGCVHHNRDDSYTIFVNPRLSNEMQIEVVRHELSHIFRKDFEKDNVQDIEVEAHEREREVITA